MRSHRSRLILTTTLLLAAGAPLPAGEPAEMGRPAGKPGVDFDEEASPLQKALEAAVEEKKTRMRNMPGAQGQACDAAIRNDNARNIQKHCEVPALAMKKLAGGDLVNPHGKVVGKRIVTETTMSFDEPAQRGEEGPRWGRVKIRGASLGPSGAGTFDPATQAPGDPRTNGSALRNAVLFPEMAENNDRDCFDSITGEHYGGYLDPALPATKSNLVPDGHPDSCYEVGGELKRTLMPAATGCTHRDGIFLDADPTDGLEDPCYDETGLLKTSLVPAVDEDRPEELDNDRDGMTDEDPADGVNQDNDCIDIHGTVHRDSACFDSGGALLPGVRELIDEDGPDAIDDDADGRLDEDPPEASHMAGCQAFYHAVGLTARPGELLDAAGEEECDLTRAIVAAVNERSKAASGGKRFFQADDDGDPDPGVLDDLDGDGHPDSIEIGAEGREVELVETFRIRCEEDRELVGGRCAEPPAKAMLVRRLAETLSPAEMERLAAGESPPVEKLALMGFTFAPPIIEWGYRVRERACVDLGFSKVCHEVFLARVGYEFDIHAGLRLPVRVTIDGVPGGAVLAGNEVTLQASVEPVDLTAAQFEEICLENGIDDLSSVSDCKRFSFPDFLDAVNPLVPDDEKDGDEMVAGYTIFAGALVRVMGIPVLQWGVDSSEDLMTMCTMQQILRKMDSATFLQLLTLGENLSADRSLSRAIKEARANCGSFTTPFGLEPDPTNPQVDRLRTFPFSGGFTVRADCAEALVRGEVITIKGKVRPICTNILLGSNGASLGVGLGIDFTAGSNLISADWGVGEDVDPEADDADDELRFRHDLSTGDPDNPVIGPLRIDNYDGGPFHDTARVEIDDFTYHLDAFQMRLRANMQFGGILTVIPDVASFTLYNFVFDAGDHGIPIAQHAGMDPMEISFPVENYGLETDVSPLTTDPALRVDDSTLRIRPGTSGDYLVEVRNLGSFVGDFHDFRVELSNRPGGDGPYDFSIHPNTDFDCIDGAGGHHFGNPFDGVADACYDGSGAVRTDRTELVDEDPPGPAGASHAERDEDGDGLADEDPPDVWRTEPVDPGSLLVTGVPPYATSTPPPGQSLVIGITPFQHPLTAPGLYPFRVSADSLEAVLFGMAGTDPLGNRRIDAADVGFIEVISFFDPRVVILPGAAAGKPGTSGLFTVEGTNASNVLDTLSIEVRFADYNQAGCSLTTMGTLPDAPGPGCPYRAVPTSVPAMMWTTVAALPAAFEDLAPLGVETAGFRLAPPRYWAGMEDTTYRFIATVTSGEDPEQPAASGSFVGSFTVEATTESRTRYIALQIAELIRVLETAGAAGTSTGGLLPIHAHPIRDINDRALARAMAGEAEEAARIHETNVRLLDAVHRVLAGGTGRGMEEALRQDLLARAGALRGDMIAAAAEPIPSAPLELSGGSALSGGSTGTRTGRGTTAATAGGSP